METKIIKESGMHSSSYKERERPYSWSSDSITEMLFKYKMKCVWNGYTFLFGTHSDYSGKEVVDKMIEESTGGTCCCRGDCDMRQKTLEKEIFPKGMKIQDKLWLEFMLRCEQKEKAGSNFDAVVSNYWDRNELLLQGWQINMLI